MTDRGIAPRPVVGGRPPPDDEHVHVEKRDHDSCAPSAIGIDEAADLAEFMTPEELSAPREGERGKLGVA